MRIHLSHGLSLGYDVRGRGRTLIFLHPIGVQRSFWKGVIERMQHHACCVSVDFRGHGESDVPGGPFTLDDLCDDVIELMRIRQTTSAVIVGCSLGGMVAQRIAGKAPDLVSGLVLAGTSHAQTPQSKQAMLKRAQDALEGMPAVAASTLERWLPPAFRTAQPEVVEQVKRWLLEDDPIVFSWGWRAIAQLNNAEILRTVTVPVLLVRGALDASTAEERMRAMMALLPGAAYVEMPEAGHLAPLEQPDAFAGILNDFISARVSPAG